MENNFSEEINANLDRILKFTQNKQCVERTKETVRDFMLLDERVNSNLSFVVAFSLGWIAELTADPKKVMEAIECYRMKSVANTVVKYKEDIANEVLTYMGNVIETSLNKEDVNNYIAWLNNGHISKLLDIASEFSENGGLKIRNDILSTLGVHPSSLQKFNEYASRLSAKTTLQQKIQYLSILKDITNLRKYEDLEKININKIMDIAKLMEKELGFKIQRRTSTIKYALLISEDRKKDKNVDFLIRKHIEHGSIENWMIKDEITKNVVSELDKIGLKSETFVASGKKVKEARIDGTFSGKWTRMLTHLVCKLVGNRTRKIPPSVSIYGLQSNTIFYKIKNEYFNAMNGDKDAAKQLLNKLRQMISTAYPTCKYPPSLHNVISEIEMLEKSIEHDIPLSHKGAKLTAKIWTRRLPNDLYDSERLRCCIYLPNGEQMEEIPLFMMDPKTTMLQYSIQGIEEPIAASTLYAGKVNGKHVIFLDTWDAGGLAYIALGSDKTKEFVIDSLIKMGKMTNSNNVLIFSKAEYGRPEEFCNYLRREGFTPSKVNFEAIDVNDIVLSNYSAGRKHHYTDAYGCNKMKGEIDVFNIEI